MERKQQIDSGLDPCPFCGGEAKLVSTLGDRYWVGCNNCGAEQGFTSPTEEEAIERWNTRAYYDQKTEGPGVSFDERPRGTVTDNIPQGEEDNNTRLLMTGNKETEERPLTYTEELELRVESLKASNEELTRQLASIRLQHSAEEAVFDGIIQTLLDRIEGK